MLGHHCSSLENGKWVDMKCILEVKVHGIGVRLDLEWGEGKGESCSVNVSQLLCEVLFLRPRTQVSLLSHWYQPLLYAEFSWFLLAFGKNMIKYVKKLTGFFIPDIPSLLKHE